MTGYTNPNQINNLSLGHHNLQQQYNPQQMQHMQSQLTSQQKYLPPQQNYHHGQQQMQMMTPSQQMHSAMTPEQSSRAHQVNQMTQNSYEKQMMEINNMNNRIMGHHMTNMSTYSIPPNIQQQTPQNQQFAGDYQQMGQHTRFPQQIASDHAPMMQPGSVPHQQQSEISSFNSHSVAQNYASIDAQADEYHQAPQQKGQQQKNSRDCQCGPEQRYCASCQVCQLPGHNRKYPGPFNKRGNWCDPHYDREVREAMKKYPESFQSFSHPYQPNLESAGGSIEPNNIKLAKMQYQAQQFQRPYQQQQYSNSSQPPIHHNDRQLGSPRGMDKSSPYTLNNHNMDNYKGNNDPYVLSRTTVDQSLFQKNDPVNFAGYNAQGEKVNNQAYYQNTPGRQNDHDFYKEYKKMNNSDFVPSNQASTNNQFRPYQSGIPPKTVKLNRNNLANR